MDNCICMFNKYSYMFLLHSLIDFNLKYSNFYMICNIYDQFV